MQKEWDGWMINMINELHKFWNISNDKRFLGEHPRCGEILNQIAEKMIAMQDDELEDILQGLDEGVLDELEVALDAARQLKCRVSSNFTMRA